MDMDGGQKIFGEVATVGRDELLAALTRIKPCSMLRPTIPILSHVLIVFGVRMSVLACDTEMSAVAQLRCLDFIEPFTTHLNTLLAIVRAVPRGAELTMQRDGDRLLVKSGTMVASLFTLPVEDFPTIKVGAFPHS